MILDRAAEAATSGLVRPGRDTGEAMSPELLVRSAAVFGNRYFAPVVAAIAHLDASGELITARAVARRCDVVDSLVRPVIARLITAEVLRAVPRTGGIRSAQYYTVNETPLTSALINAVFAAGAEMPVGPE